MKIYRIAAKVTEEDMRKWIKDLVDREFGGPESANEGWCGEVSGEIYRYLKSLGENAELWSIVDWQNDSEHPAVIENPTEEALSNDMPHSFVKWSGKYWDGIGENTLEKIMEQHTFGIEFLGKRYSIIKEH